MTPKARYRVVFNRRKSKKSRDGKFPIEIDCYIPIYQERRFIPTTIRVSAEEWTERDKLINQKNPNYITLNKRIRDLVNLLEDIEEEYRTNKIPFHLHYLSTRPRKEKELSFTKFWDEYIRNNPKRLREGTLNNKRTVLKHLKNFRKEVLFLDIDYELILDFEDYLLDYEYFRAGEYKGLEYGSIHTVFKDFKAVLNAAIDNDLYLRERSPFNKFSIEKYNKYGNTVRYLTPDEIRAIENLNFNQKQAHLIKIRDMFMLAVFTGLRYGDIVKLNEDSLVEKPDGLAIDIVQEKTRQPVYVPLFSMFDRAPERIVKTCLALGRKYLFDDITNQHINRELKVLATMAGIDKNLTFHMGRHSCATWLLSSGLSLEFVKELLGHKNLRTTQVYAKVLKQSLERELAKLQY